MEPFRSHPPPGPQDREPLFMGEHTDPMSFPGQPMFDHHSPSSLMGSNLPSPQVPGPTHMSFGPPGPSYNQPGHGPLGLFQREPPRPSLSNQIHQPNHPRQFMGPRQPFGQPRNHFNLPVQFRMQVRTRHPHQQESMTHHAHSAHAQQHHQQQTNEPPPMMHSGQNLFHPQQAHGSPRLSTPRSQNPQLRNMANRQRMMTLTPKQVQSLPQRNSNLREVPVAPGNTNMNSAHPANAANVRPTGKATSRMGPEQNTQPMTGRGRGRGQASARGRGASQPGGPGRAEAHTLSNVNTSTAVQDPEEDEETRQYRLKIEEQKRLREEILKRKEMRRQMQAGVRKKELLDRLHSNPQNQAPAPSQSQAPPPQQPVPQPVPQPAQPQQRPMAPRQQAANQGTPLSSNGAPKNFRATPAVRTRIPSVTGTNEAPQTQAGISAQPPQRTQIRATPCPKTTPPFRLQALDQEPNGL
uniref:RNA-binding protein 33 n=1 Tax=Neogobius melanostomus TaxID=47308 RepID=A0A8C6UUQ7_9GOBI